MTPTNLWPFYIGVVLLLLSATLIQYKKERYAVFTLFIAAFIFRLSAAHIDPFLHDWDEKFHALVARNLMYEPFKPMLKTEILKSFDDTKWCCNHIWLHKQPLFLWQMALSMKIFGISEFSIRYPSVLLGALMTPMLYRITKLYTNNIWTAFIAAIFMCCSGYQLLLVSGAQSIAHNDVSFGFYVLASIWAYSEYIKKHSIKWVLLIGFFAGCAILTKWLTGLLVFSGWGLNILIRIKHKETRKELLHLLLALLICGVIFLPWQFYILTVFPEEAKFEYSYNTKHIFDAIEGHNGHNEFYLNSFYLYFGSYTWILILPGVLLATLVSNYSKQIKTALFVYISIIYVFFSFIAQTKMSSYFFVVAPIGFIYISIGLSKLRKYKYTKPGYPLLALLSIYFVFNTMYTGIQINSEYRKNKIYNTTIYKNLYNYIPRNTDIVFNLPGLADVECMFYNPGINAFHYCYREEDFQTLKYKNKKIAAFKSRFGYTVPDYYKNYDKTFIIDVELKPVNGF